MVREAQFPATINAMGKLTGEDTADWPPFDALSRTRERTAFSTLVRVDLGGLSHPGQPKDSELLQFRAEASQALGVPR
jgi:hypothetical protein